MTTIQNSLLIKSHDVATVRFDPSMNHHSLHAALSFREGDVLTPFHAATTQTFASYLTVQTGVRQHITLKPDFLQYVNHSCDPNVFFNTTTMEFTSLKDIAAGEELCFFYPSTEWDMAQPFTCRCGTPNCLKEIRGAAFLDKEILYKYRLTDFIISQLKITHGNAI